MAGSVQKPVVYLDSSFVSRLAGGRTKANHVLAQQAASREWWSLMREQVQPVVSVLVWTEIVRGDPGCVARRKDVIRIPVPVAGLAEARVGGTDMSDGNFFTELAETRRRLWAESDGSLEGYAALCSRIAREAVAADAKEQAGRKVPDKRTPPRRRRKAHGPMMVREDAPGYGAGETSDLARKGNEGE